MSLNFLSQTRIWSPERKRTSSPFSSTITPSRLGFSCTVRSGDDQSIQAFLASIKALNPYLDDELVNTKEYGVGDILLAEYYQGNRFGDRLNPADDHCMFLFYRHKAGSFEEGTGKKLLDALQSDSAYPKFLNYWKKLKAWGAFKSTANDGECHRPSSP
jgi:hypothetical protein